MRKVLVTGGAGFIGSNLCEALLGQGDEVCCLDNFATGKIGNLLPLLQRYPERFRLIVGDIRKPEDCRKAVEGMEYVLHEAALGSVPRSIDDPVTTNEVNVTGFLNMLVASRDAGIKRFVFAASSSTYGDSKELPKTEEVIGRPFVSLCRDQICKRTLCRCICGNLWVGICRFALFQCVRPPSGPFRSLCSRNSFVRKKLMDMKARLSTGTESIAVISPISTMLSK